MQAPPDGKKIRADKRLNFPDTALNIEALTEKDRDDLAFIVQHADMVGYSFVQTVSDVMLLEEELTRWQQPGRPVPVIVLKIETKQAVRNLPDLIVQAAGRRPTAVMIARGDLAIEIGYNHMAEMQEELLWFCEAAHVPVIWATQVLENLAKEAPTFRGHTDEDTGQTIMAGTGELHLEILVERLAREFHVAAHVSRPQVAYKETMRRHAEGEGKFVRQSGGRGQYGYVKLRLVPLPRGDGFAFDNAVVGGVIPKEYIPAIQAGVVEAMQHGSVAGCPVVDVQVSVYDGSYHEVDSSEWAFKHGLQRDGQGGWAFPLRTDHGC